MFHRKQAFRDYISVISWRLAYILVKVFDLHISINILYFTGIFLKLIKTQKMLKRTEILNIIIVYILLEQASCQIPGFGENKLHQELHKSTRVRVRSCRLGSSAKCQYCDCYGDSCSANKVERTIEHFYGGIFVNKNEFRKMLNLGSNHDKVGRIKTFKTAASSRSCKHKFREDGCCET